MSMPAIRSSRVLRGPHHAENKARYHEGGRAVSCLGANPIHKATVVLPVATRMVMQPAITVTDQPDQAPMIAEIDVVAKWSRR